MSKKIFKFHDNLKQGKAGETKLLALFGGLSATDGRKGDMTLGSDKVELKTDNYSATSTDNFFFERYSNVDKGTDGGPWQAKLHGCKWFVYYFTSSELGYVFDVDVLVDALNKSSLMQGLKPVEVRNIRWTTVGFKVPRNAVAPMFVWRGNPAVLESGDKALFQKFLGTAD